MSANSRASGVESSNFGVVAAGGVVETGGFGATGAVSSEAVTLCPGSTSGCRVSGTLREPEERNKPPIEGVEFTDQPPRGSFPWRSGLRDVSRETFLAGACGREMLHSMVGTFNVRPSEPGLTAAHASMPYRE